MSNSATKQEDALGDGASVPVIPLSLFMRAMWAARSLVIFTSTLILLLACLYIAVRPRTYIATTVIAPPSPSSSTSGGGLSSALSMASGLGVSFGATSTASFDKYLQVLKSTRLAEMLSHEDGVMDHLYNVEWNGETHTWQPHPGSFATWKQGFKKSLGMQIKPITPEVVAEYLRKIVTLQNAPSTGGLTVALRSQITIVTLSYKDREFAVALLNYILRDADAIIRREQLANVSNRIVYLDGQIKKTTDVNLVTSLSQIMTDQERTLMILKADKYYAVDVVDPPYADSTPGGFSSAIILILSVALGFLVSMIFVFFILRQRLIDATETGEHPFAQPFPSPFDALKFWH